MHFQCEIQCLIPKSKLSKLAMITTENGRRIKLIQIKLNNKQVLKNLLLNKMLTLGGESNGCIGGIAAGPDELPPPYPSLTGTVFTSCNLGYIFSLKIKFRPTPHFENYFVPQMVEQIANLI